MKAERAEGPIAVPGTPQASIKQSPSSPVPASPRKQLSISHLSLAYHTTGKRLVCRICRYACMPERKMRIDKTLSVTMFPDDAPWSDLSGHCEHEHPQSFEKLINMNPKELTELRLKYGVLR
ncbi:uncharacterized protein LAESUDRAFT_639041 [Laetiporus sulphureus 93-53]|uniref:Uncharacterized protein n=1 Tax=Laetiporus sulphureus 93-53 TaxID=1314785 RepID=A0A165IM29_9APHY|nr:uncharacterized protein LAESUDRAFT_639041 [Laetiporus sulphureus 93-53]KZT13269.1 hypothetical protein LAESUDRAFT_639041 [Laetiporus sulphureus 93-53]